MVHLLLAGIINNCVRNIWFIVQDIGCILISKVNCCSYFICRANKLKQTELFELTYPCNKNWR